VASAASSRNLAGVSLHFSDNLVAFGFLFRLNLALFLVLFQPRIALTDDALDLGKLPRLLLRTHLCLLEASKGQAGDLEVNNTYYILILRM
jgi:hypothetical protein